MIVSFDLDDTLFIDAEEYAAEEKLRFPYCYLYKERLRLGTIGLMKKITENGIALWIYTTSFRSESYIRSLFRHYGIKLDGVVNGARHQREVQGDKKEPMPSKYPSKYRIDLHIDDDISVLQNGRTYGFRVFLMRGDNPEWAEEIWAEIQRLKGKEDLR